MLGKLIKYEFRSTAIYFLPIYAALILVSALNYAVNSLSYKHYSGAVGFAILSSMSLYILLAFVLAATTYIVIIIRFYKNLLGTEGYLMFTLPVSVEDNILAKLIVAMVWFIGSVGLGILTVGPVLKVDFFGTFFSTDGGFESIAFIVLVVIFCIASIAVSFLFFYFCMCIGQLFNSHKFIASAATYLITQGVFQVLSILLIIVSANSYAFSFMGPIDTFFEKVQYAPLYLGIGVDLATIGIAVLLFFIDSKILKNKLNLT